MRFVWLWSFFVCDKNTIPGILMSLNPIQNQINAVTLVIVELSHSLDLYLSSAADVGHLATLQTTINCLSDYRSQLITMQKQAYADQLDFDCL